MAGPLRAESVLAGGVAFQVDSLSQADAETVKVGLFGETFLVNSERLPLFVVREYFKRPDQAARLGSSGFKKLISNSLEEGQGELAAMALTFVLARPNDPLSAGLKEYVVSLGEGNLRVAAAAVFRRVIESPPEILPPGPALAAVLFYAGRENVDWLRARAITLVFRCSAELRHFIEERFAAEAALQDNNRGEKIADFVLKLLGPQEPLFVKLRLICNRIIDLRAASESGRPERIFPLLKSEPDNPLLATVLVPMAMEVLHGQAAQALAAGQNDRALHILGWISPSQRTPRTHELTLDALKNFSPQEVSYLGDRQTAAFLKVLADNDSALKDAYLAALERQISSLLAQGKVETSERYLALLLEVRPDPDSANDAIRIQQVYEYLETSRRETARIRLAEVKTGIGLGTRLGLVARGYYFNIRHFAGVLAAAALLVFLFLRMSHLRCRETLQGPDTSRPETELDSEEGCDDDRPEGFSFSRFVHHMSPRRYEYDQCLSELGLRSGASAKDIKTAYRNMVKAVHPDLHGEAGSGSGKFVNLTTTYNRILELRKELGIVDNE